MKGKPYEKATHLSRPGHAQTRTSTARRPSTVPSAASSVNITCTGRRLRPPTHELKQWNSSRVVTHSAPAVHQSDDQQPINK